MPFTITGTSSSTNYVVWAGWNQLTGTSTQTITIAQTWGAWNASPYVTLQYQQAAARPYVPRVAVVAPAAVEAAERLLLEHLDDAQRETYRARGCFYLHVKGKRYRVDKGWAGNVKLVDETDRVLTNYCIHPNERIPDQDNMLAQKLLLEADEAEFLRVANAS